MSVSKIPESRFPETRIFSTDYDKTGRYIGIGIFTIVAESDGEGATKLGKLKSGAGWHSLDFPLKFKSIIIYIPKCQFDTLGKFLKEVKNQFISFACAIGGNLLLCFGGGRYEQP